MLTSCSGPFPGLLLPTVVGYEEFALTHPPEVVIKWIQAVFAAFDEIVQPSCAQDNSAVGGLNVVKFETFHDFYFLVSGCPQVKQMRAAAERSEHRQSRPPRAHAHVCSIRRAHLA